MVAGYIQEWADKKLVTLYVANGDIYIEFPNFGKHQVGLRKDRESKSSIPSSEDGELYTFPDSSGINPDSSGKNRVKLSKVNIKLSEVNIGADKSANPEPTYEDCAEDGESIPKKPKSKYAADPRTKHVAIQAWKQATNRYPPKEIYDTVIQTLGDSPDIEKLKNVFAQWVGRGYNRTNITGVLDWYVNGIANNARSKNTGMDAVKAELARLEQENGG
jgi:hypothetical protein